MPEKPRGMHWRTYERLRRRAKQAQAKALADLMDLDLTDAFRFRSAEDCRAKEIEAKWKRQQARGTKPPPWK